MNTETKTFWELLSGNAEELRRWQDICRDYPLTEEFAEKLEDHFTERLLGAFIVRVDYLSVAIFTDLLKNAFEKVNFHDIAELISLQAEIDKKSERASLRDFQDRRITDIV